MTLEREVCGELKDGVALGFDGLEREPAHGTGFDCVEVRLGVSGKEIEQKGIGEERRDREERESEREKVRERK